MGVIKGGKYYPDEQPVKQQVKPVVSQIATRGNIDRDYEDHAHDLIQPYMVHQTLILLSTILKTLKIMDLFQIKRRTRYDSSKEVTIPRPR